MAADFQLVAFRESMFTMRDFVIEASTHMGYWMDIRADLPDEEVRKVEDRFLSLPFVSVGECSLLKAALFDEEETFVPNPIQKILDLIGPKEIRKCDEAFVQGVKEALALPNQTGYKLADPRRVILFVESHIGWWITYDLI